MRLNVLGTTIFLSFALLQSQAQTTESPGEHMSYLIDREEILSKNYLSYMSEVAHGERARKMEKRRMELINSVKEAQRDASRLRPFKGDASLRNAFTEYWGILLSIFNEDYHKIVDMEEVAEQSYDAMEAYLLAQELAGKRLGEAHEKVNKSFESFAASHHVRLTEGKESKLSKKLEQAGAVNKYFSKIYLIYFKASVQETNTFSAFKIKDMNGVEQSRVSLLRYAEEGLNRLDTLKPYKGDGSLITATRKLLEFYKVEATTDIPVQADFLVKNEEFQKIKKSFDAKPAAKQTQADIDAFNKAVKTVNDAVNNSNKIANDSNTRRSKAIDNWNITKKRFMDAHIPHK
jgi:hypothetical protein